MNNLINSKIKLKLIKFFVFGISVNLFVALIYFTFIFFDINTIISFSFAYLIGIFLSIYLNKNYTFDYKNYNSKIWIKFFLIHLFCYALSQVTNETLLFILSNFYFKYIFGFVISIGIAASTNFICMNLVINKTLSYKEN